MKNHDIKKLLKNGLKSHTPDVWNNIVNAGADTYADHDILINETRESHIFVSKYGNLFKYSAASIIVITITCIIIFLNIFEVNVSMKSASPDVSSETVVSATPVSNENTPTLTVIPTPTPFVPSPTEIEIPRSNTPIKPLKKSAVSEEAPEVKTFFELNKEGLVDGEFISGFNVNLPMIVSDNPGAKQINNEINKIKEEIIGKYNNAGDLNKYGTHYKYSYETLYYDSMMFINIRYTISYWCSEICDYTCNFAYDFVSDKVLSNQDIATLYNVDLNKITEKINYIFYIYTAPYEPFEIPYVMNTDDYYLYINSNGELMAEALTRVYVPQVSILNLVKGSYITEVVHYFDVTNDGIKEKIILDLNKLYERKASVEIYKINNDKEELIWKESIDYQQESGFPCYFIYEQDGLNYIVRWYPYGNSSKNYFYCEVFSLSSTGQKIVLKEEAFTLNDSANVDDIKEYYKKIEPYIGGKNYVIIEKFNKEILFSTSADTRYSKIWDESYLEYIFTFR